MRTWIGASASSRVAGVMMTAWLCGMAPAWAGGGGSDSGVFQTFLEQVCGLVGATSCLQVPTLTQTVLAIAAYQNTPPDFVRGPLGNFAGICSVSTTGTGGLPICSENNAVSTVNPLAPSIALADLSNLTPLAFQYVSGQAVPVALGTPNASSFLYPVLTGPDGHHMLDVVLDYGPWKSRTFVKNQPVGSFSFPLVILNSDNSETPVVATLNLTATCNGVAVGCLTGTVTGVGTKPLSADQLGIQIGFALAASPNVPTPHGIFELQLPVIVTLLSDPVYFGADSNGNATFINQFTGLPTAFSQDDRGFTSPSVGHPIGVSPYPAPLCPASGCPSGSPPTFYGFCATIAGSPAAATFVSVGTDGTTYGSSPVGQQPRCP